MPRRKNDLLWEVLDAIDLFNDPIRFRLKGKRVLATTLGGVLTIALVIFVATQIGTEFADMAKFRNPQLYEIKELEDIPKTVSLDPSSNFFLAIALTVNSSSLNMTSASLINFETTYNQVTKYENGTKIEVKYPVFWAPCNESDFSASIYGSNVYTQNSLNYAYCAYGINYTHPIEGTCPERIAAKYTDCFGPIDIEIHGLANSDEYWFVQSVTVPCDPDDPTLPYGMSCDTSTNVKNYLRYSEIKENIYYSYSLINTNNYETPNITFLDNIYWNLNPQIYKKSDILIDRVTIQDFDDFMFEEKDHNRSYYSIPSEKMRELETFQTSTSTTNTLIKWNIRRSNLNTVMTRTYLKITGILTDLGGLAKAILFIAGFIAVGYIRFKYNLMVANELFDYDFPAPPPVKSASGGIKDIMDNSNRNLFGISADFSDTKHLAAKMPQDAQHSFISPRADFAPNKPIRDYAEKLASRKKRLDHGEWAYVKMLFRLLCCMKSKEEDLGKKARASAMDHLDIVALCGKLQELNRLKFFLLNPQQRQAFDFIEKPLVTLHSKKPLHSDSIDKLARSQIKRISFGEVSNAMSESIYLRNTHNIVHADEDESNDFSSLSKYGKLYVAYRHIQDDANPDNELFNKKLLGMLGHDILRVFRRVDQLVEDEPDAKQFEEIIKQILETPSAGAI